MADYMQDIPLEPTAPQPETPQPDKPESVNNNIPMYPPVEPMPPSVQQPPPMIMTPQPVIAQPAPVIVQAAAPAVQVMQEQKAPGLLYRSTPVNCENCNQKVLTKTTKKINWKTVLGVVCLCIVCCPLFWLPIYFRSCSRVEHECPNCGVLLGVYEK